MIDLQKKIFITGVTWFIWANLLRRVISLWAKNVHVLVRKDSDMSRIQDIREQATLHYFSLEDRDATIEHISKISPEIVYHIAAAGTAVGRVPLSLDDLMATNTLGSIHLMDACHQTGVCEIFIHTGSSSEYGQKDIPMREDDVIEPNNLYGLSKAGATHYARYLGRQKWFPIATYRIFAAYGQYEDRKRLIPTLLDAYMNWVSPKLSSPDSVRDFIHIDDIVSAYLEGDRAIASPGEIINIATGKQYRISEVVETIKSILHSSIEPIYGDRPLHQIEPTSWVADITKMREILHIAPKTLEEGLTSTLQWIKNPL